MFFPNLLPGTDKAASSLGANEEQMVMSTQEGCCEETAPATLLREKQEARPAGPGEPMRSLLWSQQRERSPPPAPLHAGQRWLLRLLHSSKQDQFLNLCAVPGIKPWCPCACSPQGRAGRWGRDFTRLCKNCQMIKQAVSRGKGACTVC